MIRSIKADKISYSPVKRNKQNVLYIPIHFTGCVGDTAANQGYYFKSVNRRQAGAHFFIDQKGNIVKSISLDRTAWAVGGNKWDDCNKTGGGKLYRKVTNANSVSIELCDNMTKDPSPAQIKAVKKCIKYIRKYCPNATKVVRHFDVTGKHCPARMMDGNKWRRFLTAIGES